ncbi:MAG: (d)CMP kinase [Candidatus Omnitrophota bacterium]|nr:(d)CMP kinase [Candidatus Omnitrophota bacterium]
MIIAIDGPAGSGKTTVAKLLSKRLGIFYLDTGATYRALTLAVLTSGIDLADQVAVLLCARALNLRLEGEKVYLDGREVTADIRAPRIDKNISVVVKDPSVREVMVALQRTIASGRDVVVEGRDITTVVFPNAEFKFYLDADPGARVHRRFAEFNEKKIEANLDEVTQDLTKRDYADKNRDVGALRVSPEAVYIDTTHIEIEGVLEKILTYIQHG